MTKTKTMTKVDCLICSVTHRLQQVTILLVALMDLMTLRSTSAAY